MRNFKNLPEVADLPPMQGTGGLTGPAAHIRISPAGARLQDVLWAPDDGYESVPVNGLGADASLYLAGRP